MILCPGFTFIHIPKNAGSFVETILRKSFDRTPRALTGAVTALDRLVTNRILNRKPHCYASVPWQFALKGYAEILVHGFASEAPERSFSKPFLAVLRDPLDRSISEFEFQWWEWSGARHPNETEIRAVYPEWPAIRSFRDYVHLRDRFHTRFQEGVPHDQRVGIQTETFIRFFCRNPEKLLARGTSSLSLERVLDDLYNLHFLNMDAVNSELADFLRTQGVSEETAHLAETHGRVLPANRGRSEHKNFSRYYDEALLEEVRAKEAIVLEIWNLIERGYRTAADLKNRSAA